MHMAILARKRKRLARRNRLYVFLLAFVAVGMIITLLWLVANSRNFMLFGNIVTHVETDEKVVALTLDDGPLPGTTEETLKILRELDVKATFFTIGVESERHPDQLRKIIAAEHEVGNHSYSHNLMLFTTYGTVTKEIEDTDTLIRAAGYTGQIPFRVPYNYKFITLPYYLMKHERSDISHNVSTNEGWEYSPEEIAADVVRKVSPGSIVLLHPMYDHTLSSRRAIPLIVDELRAKGYRFVTVSQLLLYEKS